MDKLKLDPKTGALFCFCGCGQTIKRYLRRGRLLKFKPGHQKVKDGTPISTIPFTCVECGKQMKRQRLTSKYCSRECYWKVRGFKNVPDIKVKWKTTGGRNYVDRTEFRESRSPVTQRKYMHAIVKACELCGWRDIPEILELHHRNRNQKDGSRENLMLLCPTCHEVIHYLEKSGKHDSQRIVRANKIREAFGLSDLNSGVGRTTVQEIYDNLKARGIAL